MPARRSPQPPPLTPAQYEALLAFQGGGCAICGRPPASRRLDRDHDHRTGELRGLLCYSCNHRLLGRGLDNPARLRAAADYLDDPPARRIAQEPTHQ